MHYSFTHLQFLIKPLHHFYCRHFFLSLFVWFELIVFALDSNNGSKKYDIFYFCSCTIELGLIIFFSVAFSPLLYLSGVFILLIGLAYFIMRLFIWLYPKWILKRFKNKRKTLTFLTIIISFIIAAYIMKLSSPLFRLILKNLPEEYMLPK